ncbi:MFS transporter [Kribbella sp. NPDC048915]|uniref:MFS transporter n=1 Tax=Kribbella sp. NPDC048915 TaxID=3155148 RepID=UPI0033D60127
MLLSIDVSVLYLALPALSRDLGATNVEQLWIVDIYSFMLAGFLVTMGGLADRIGRRRLMMYGAAAFGIASTAAAFSPSAEALIASRAVMGVAGATLMPTALATIRQLFAGTRQLSSAIGAWFGCFMIGMLLGPLIGGLLLDRFSWGAVFLIAVPVMGLLLTIGPRLLPESRDEAAGRLDALSVVLSLGALLPIAWAVKHIARDGFKPGSIAVLAIGLLVGVAFVVRQRRVVSPLLDVSLFVNRAFSCALAISAVGGIVMAGVSLVTAIYLQSVAGLSPFTAGLWLIPQNVAMIAGFTAAPAIAKRIAQHQVIAGGLAIAAGGFALITQANPSSFEIVLAGMAIASFGVAAPMALGANVLMSAAPEEKAASAASIMETSGELGVALGVASLGSLSVAAYRFALRPELDRMPVDDVTKSAAVSGIEDAVQLASELPPTIADAVQLAAREAFVSSVHTVATVASATFVVLALTVIALLRADPRAAAGHKGSLA